MTIVEEETTTQRLQPSDVRTVAAEYAANADTDARLAPQVIQAIIGSGLPRHFVTARWGGTAGTFTELATNVATIAEGCMSAAWCGLIYATSARFVGYLPEAGQQAIWADNPAALIAAGVVPGGVANRTSNGWTLTGTWQPLSGADFADWALVCAKIDGSTNLGFFAVPASDYRVIHTWDTVGMRGTGSHTVVVRDAFVPTALAFPQTVVLTGSPDITAPPHLRAPLLAVGPTLFTAPALGAARAALSQWTSAASSHDHGSPTEAFHQQVLAETATDIDVATLLTTRALDIADHTTPTPQQSARNIRDAGYTARLLTGAVDRLFAASGGAAQRRSHQLQRTWRDVHCATSHAALRADRAAALYAKSVWH